MKESAVDGCCDEAEASGSTACPEFDAAPHDETLCFVCDHTRGCHNASA